MVSHEEGGFSNIFRALPLLLLLVIVLVVSIALAVAVGPTAVSIETYFSDPTAQMILLSIRLPRVIAAVLVGSGLAAAGTAMQGLFKNSMADPYIIGTSQGGALGASFAIVLLNGYALPLCAFIGAVGATFIVYGIATRHGRAPVETLLLSGIALSMFLSAILSFFMYSAGKSLHQIMFWLMGGFWNVSWSDTSIALLVPLGCVILAFFSRDLNILTLGEEDALHLGINVERLKQILLFLSAFITGIAVSIAGAIGFVGLITPHVMRQVVGPDHRVLLPGAMITGGILLLWSDTLARSIANEIPVGIVTSLFGAPFFIYLLRRRMAA